MVAVGGNLAIDAFDDARANAVRGHQEIAVGHLARVAGERIEQVRQVGADFGGSRQQTDVLVEPRRLAVVVAGPDVAVAPDR